MYPSVSNSRKKPISLITVEAELQWTGHGSSVHRPV